MYDTYFSRSAQYFWRRIKHFNRVRYQWSLQARDWYDLSARSCDDAVVIGGCGRSGTTLLREILNRHPRVFCGPETSMFGLPFWPGNIAPYWEMDENALRQDAAQCANLVRFSEDFYRGHAAQAGKARWADKTPNNVRAIERILTWFPNARFIHVLRDGRDVACSLRHHPKQKIVKGRLVDVNTDNPISFCARRWLQDTSRGLAFRGHPRYMEIRYESLVIDPEKVIRHLCDFIREDFSMGMLDGISDNGNEMECGRFVNNQNATQRITTQRVGRWKRDLSRRERYEFVDWAGELLIAMGYVDSHDWALN